MLAGLLAQAEEEGATRVTLRAVVEEASALGAGRALARLGLSDAGAGHDIGELRGLLAAWRDTKLSMRRTAIGWVVKTVLTMIVLALGVRLGMAGLDR